MLRSVSVFLIMLVLLPTFAQADELTPQKAEDIKRLLRVSKIEDCVMDLVDMSIAQAKYKAEQDGIVLSQEAQKVIDKELHSLYQEKFSEPGGLYDMLVPIYADIFSHKEIKEYIAFHLTPLGKKIADTSGKASTKISFASLAVMAKASQETPERILRALQREGLLKTAPKAGEAL